VHILENPTRQKNKIVTQKTLTPFCQDLVPELHFFGDAACMHVSGKSISSVICLLPSE
jgi:hypothetical protein